MLWEWKCSISIMKRMRISRSMKTFENSMISRNGISARNNGLSHICTVLHQDLQFFSRCPQPLCGPHFYFVLPYILIIVRHRGCVSRSHMFSLHFHFRLIPHRILECSMQINLNSDPYYIPHSESPLSIIQH